jgi:hypothetical protein
MKKLITMSLPDSTLNNRNTNTITKAVLGMEHMKCLAKDTVQISLAKLLISAQLRNLLHKIHNEYPKVFTKARLDTELTNIQQQLQQMDIGILSASGSILYTPKLKIPVTIRLKPEVASELQQITYLPHQITPVKTREIAQEDKCMARVYSSKSIIYKSLDDPTITLYGRQCKSKHMSGSAYCGLHDKHLPHGIWGVEPEKHIKAHFQRHYDSAVAKSAKANGK